METVLRSAGKDVVIGAGNPFCIIGERINPTGRKLFQEQLRKSDLGRVEVDIDQQVAGGAMVLDINMGAPLADEADLMVRAVRLAQSRTDLPLCLDSSIVEVASNVSFGMPDRIAIGCAFLPMAIAAGLTSAIMDARSPDLVRACKAADLLLNRDEWGAAWIAAHRAQAQAQAQAGT